MEELNAGKRHETVRNTETAAIIAKHQREADRGKHIAT
jgi:hypothetical protein